MNHNHLIKFSFALLFIIISTSSFALSYLNLMAAAIEAGIIPALAWLWPLCIDAFIIMGSLFILQSNLNQEPSWQGWTVLILFTVVSCVFNIAHSPSDLMSRAAHAAPPVALCGSLEMLMIRIKRDLLRTTEEYEETSDQPGVISSEKRSKVLLWFTENPESTIEQARKSLGMGWGTVRDIRVDLERSGDLRRV